MPSVAGAGLEAGAVVARRGRPSRGPSRRDLDEDVRGAGVAGDVRQALLDDAVDHELRVVVERVDGRRVQAQLGLQAGAAGERVDLGAQRGREPEVVERDGPQLAREAHELLHRLGGDRLGRAQLVAQRGRRLQRRRLRGAAAPPVSAWLASSWRSRARRARSSSWPRRTSPAVRERSASRRSSMRSKAEFRRATSAEPAAGRRGRSPPGPKLDVLHRGDDALERLEAPPQDHAVDEDRAEHGGEEHEEALALDGGVEVEARDDGRGQEHRADERGVEGQDLRDERGLGERPGSGGRHGSQAPHRQDRRRDERAPAPRSTTVRRSLSFVKR